MMFPSRYINQLIKAFASMNINCYMKDLHFKCNDFKSTDQVKNIRVALKFYQDDQKHVLEPATLIKECTKNKKNANIRCSFNIHASLDEDIILGEPFFKNYMVAFDLDNFQVGLNVNYLNSKAIPVIDLSASQQQFLVLFIEIMIYSFVVYMVVKGCQKVARKAADFKPPEVQMLETHDFQVDEENLQELQEDI